jgi:hypothetical protein
MPRDGNNSIEFFSIEKKSGRFGEKSGKTKLK